MKVDKPRSKLVLCVRSNGSDDLEPRKVYQVLADRAAEREGYLRIIDESGEDYLYPAEYFVPVRVSPAIVRELVWPSHGVSHAALQKARRG